MNSSPSSGLDTSGTTSATASTNSILRANAPAFKPSPKLKVESKPFVPNQDAKTFVPNQNSNTLPLMMIPGSNNGHPNNYYPTMTSTLYPVQMIYVPNQPPYFQQYVNPNPQQHMMGKGKFNNTKQQVKSTENDANTSIIQASHKSIDSPIEASVENNKPENITTPVAVINEDTNASPSIPDSSTSQQETVKNEECESTPSNKIDTSNKEKETNLEEKPILIENERVQVVASNVEIEPAAETVAPVIVEEASTSKTDATTILPSTSSTSNNTVNSSTILPKEGWKRNIATTTATSDWRRAGDQTEASATSVSEMMGRKESDGVQRYDKISLLLILFSPGVRLKKAPESLLTQYPLQAMSEKLPFLPKGFKVPQSDEDISNSEDFAKGREGIFKFNASKDNDESDPEVIVRKAQLILNKLSLTTFDRLSTQFMSLGFETKPDLMVRVVDMIVLKAQMEEPFCYMYADLCRKITDEWTEPYVPVREVEIEMDKEALEEQQGEAEAQTVGAEFRKKLLSRCQAEFEIDRFKELEAIRNSDDLIDVKEEKEIILKKRYTGHMRFIGEIYMKDLVKPKIMMSCLTELLNSGEEENLVFFCKLIQTIGAKLSQYDAKKKKSFTADLFVRITLLSAEHSSSRIRFILKDLIDSRNSGWQVRREVEKAKKLDKADDKGGKTGPSPKSASTPKGNFQDARQLKTVSEDEWTTVVSSVKKKPDSQFVSKPPLKQPSPASAPASKKKTVVTGAAAGFGQKAAKGSQSPKSKAKGKGDKFKRDDLTLQVDEEDAAAPDQPEPEPEPETPRIVYGPPTKEKLTEVKSAVEEYMRVELEEEVIARVAAAMPGYPQGMGDAMKMLLNFVVEKKPKERDNFCKLLTIFHGRGMLTAEETLRGLMLFLAGLDDLTMDVPQASQHTAFIMAHMLRNSIISDISFLKEANFNDEDSSGFSGLSRLIGETLQCMEDVVVAEALYRESALDIIPLLENLLFPKQTVQEALQEFSERYKLPFLLSLP